jgi:hypothetical protein
MVDEGPIGADEDAPDMGDWLQANAANGKTTIGNSRRDVMKRSFRDGRPTQAACRTTYSRPNQKSHHWNHSALTKRQRRFPGS